MTQMISTEYQREIVRKAIERASGPGGHGGARPDALGAVGRSVKEVLGQRYPGDGGEIGARVILGSRSPPASSDEVTCLDIKACFVNLGCDGAHWDAVPSTALYILGAGGVDGVNIQRPGGTEIQLGGRIPANASVVEHVREQTE